MHPGPSVLYARARAALKVAYLSAAVWFAVAYWCDKWELLRLSRRPVAYGGALSEAITNMLPFATVTTRRVVHGGLWGNGEV